MKGKTAFDIIKEAYEKGDIEKGEYEKAMERLLKNEIEGRKISDEVVSEIRIIEKDGKTEIVLEKGEIEIPSGISVEVVKKDDEISIITGNAGKGVVRLNEINGESRELDVNKEDTILINEAKDSKSGIPEEDAAYIPAELEDIGDHLGTINWMETERSSKAIVCEVRDEVELVDLRKKFREERKEKDAETEEKKEDEENRKEKPGLVASILKIIKKAKEESRSEKLRRMSLENLGRIKEIKDEKKSIVGVAYVLKEFLQIKFKINKELTYRELLDEIKGRDIKKDIKDQLLDFFKGISMSLYAGVRDHESFSKAYNLAEKTINELSRR